MKSNRRLLAIFVAISLILGASSYAHGAEPQSALEVTVPDYEVSTVANLDYVDIPGGHVLLVDGKPRVPYYSVSVDYPKGHRVQKVTLAERSGLVTATGLKLPTVVMEPWSFSGSGLSPDGNEGWYPKEEYNWKVWDNPDGSATLVLIIYPFYYNPKTTDVKFYKNYTFDIKYIFSSVSIVCVAMDRNVYDPGDHVKIDIKLKNEEKPQDVILIATVKKDIAGKIMYTFPQKSLKDLAGDDSLSLRWKTKGFPTGDYNVEVKLKDKSGNTLDKKNVAFRIGNPICEITDFRVTPQHFKIGDKVNITLKFKNTGSCDLVGDCVFRIREAKKVVKEITYEFTDLAPGHATDFKDTWDTKDAKKGAIYYILAYVRYDGTATPAENAVVSTNRFPEARFTYSPEKPAVDEKITFDAVGSSDPDGKIIEYKWEFGDGGSAKSKEVTHCYMLPGEYKVLLTVTDNEGAIDQAVETVFIEE